VLATLDAAPTYGYRYGLTTPKDKELMAKKPIESWMFALVVVRKGNRFLLVHERKHGQRWYLPAGRVEFGETFPEAAKREVLEEAGVPISLDGILRIEHSPRLDGSARMRMIFLASPIDDTSPKSEPDDESLEARWVTIEELDTLGYSLRSPEVIRLFEQVQRGVTVMPMSMLTQEGGL
jgi:phosphatase NudJ